MTSELFRALALLLGAVAPAACSRSNDPPPDLWVWQFVEMPSEDNDFFEALPAVLKFVDNEGNVPPESRLEFCNALHHVTNASRNSGQLKYTKFPMTSDRFWNHYESGGQTIEAGRLLDLTKAAKRISQSLIDTGDLDAAASLAQSLLLLGYQMSRNGEAGLVAAIRCATWGTALDTLLIAGHEQGPQVREHIEKTREALRAECAETRGRDPNRIYYPFR